MNGFLQEYGLNIVAVIIVLAFIVFASVFGDTITGGINDITSDFFAKSGITTDINGDEENPPIDIVDGNGADGKHYHNDQLFTGTCDGTEYNNGVELITFTIAGYSYQAEKGMTWQEWIDSDYIKTNGTYWVDVHSSSPNDYVAYKTNGGWSNVHINNKSTRAEWTTDVIVANNAYLTSPDFGPYGGQHSGGGV